MSPGRGDGVNRGYEVSTFGESLAELSEAEQRELAEQSLAFTESWFANDSLGFTESWFGGDHGDE
jgi:hypothetical protein